MNCKTSEVIPHKTNTPDKAYNWFWIAQSRQLLHYWISIMNNVSGVPPQILRQLLLTEGKFKSSPFPFHQQPLVLSGFYWQEVSPCYHLPIIWLRDHFCFISILFLEFGLFILQNLKIKNCWSPELPTRIKCFFIFAMTIEDKNPSKWACWFY